jgi:hypothetical protein
MAPKSNIPHTGIVADVWICVCVCVCAFVRASKINAGTAEQDREDLSVVSLCVPDLQPLVSAPPPSAPSVMECSFGLLRKSDCKSGRLGLWALPGLEEYRQHRRLTFSS